MADFLVKRSNLRECRVVESATPEVGPGQALLRVESFGLTANNVTYAAMGEVMSYWDFFAAEDGWGRMPVWGFAEVEQSKVEGVEEETRVFGYLPPSSHLLVTPVRVNEYSFTDGAPHRAELPAAYHQYSETKRDPFYRADTEDLQMLLRPLFFTSFLIDDQLAAEGLTASGPVLFSSASSKTSISAAYLLARRPEAELIALTSAANREFVEGLGIYDRTVAYEEIDSLDRRPVTYVDVAGDALLRRAIHERFGEHLIRSMVVGVTHWEGMRVGPEPLPGPAPTFFFAATRIEKRSADWGRAGLELRVAEAWAPFCKWTGGWLGTLRGRGFDEVREAYLDVLESRVDPSTAHVISLEPGTDGRAPVS